MDDVAATVVDDARFAIADTVSPETAARLRLVYAVVRQLPPRTRPTSTEEWDAMAARAAAFIAPMGAQLVASLGATVEEDAVGGVAVVRVRPPGFEPGGRLLVYVHGGGYVIGSAASMTALPALLAAAGGGEVLSIDYTLAPRGTWRTATAEVVTVWRALLDQGVAPDTVGFVGDSAGAGLAAGSVLRMRDEGLPLPGALLLVSPWSDVTPVGDTWTTLAHADPTLAAEVLAWGADVYADRDDQRHPWVSPVYGDYSRPFPPTLIQGGTRELFVSHFVRHYQAIRAGGHECVLDLYEAMPHVFHTLLPDSWETRTAITRATDFLGTHLAG